MFAFLLTMTAVWAVVRGHWRRVRWSNSILTRYCRLGLKVLKVKVNYRGLENYASVPNALFVCNHLSYMDVLVIHARVPACFVTSREIRETPVLGQVCQVAGCLFVERRNKNNIHAEVSEISAGLREGLNVCIFPEATSTNGEQILRFRRPLYVAALDAPAAVLPICLNYHTVGGEPINQRTRDKICWYGDMDFVSHLWALAGSGGVNADLIFMPPIHPVSTDDATQLAERSQAAVESVFRPVKKETASSQDAVV
ncbi:MAG: 1-acyl-sn-glycerol-3-phosphate acyltransferase [Bdellovibrionales bacterium]|nr:1-acyl-sn-glycerol-3-phosphate acyltransferase [Bdellovibrionales bacterium]